MPGTDLSAAGMPRKRVVKAAMPAASDTQALIEAITKASRDPSVDIDKMRFLLDTRRALMDEEAEQEWRDAMALAQAEIGRDLEGSGEPADAIEICEPGCARCRDPADLHGARLWRHLRHRTVA